MTTQDIIRTEAASLLPTYAQIPLALVRGENVWVWDADGNRYLDLYGGHCVTVLGHCPPPVVHAIQEQAETLLFYSNVVHSPVRAEAAARLAALAPSGIGHPFLCNSGTEANETALKLARTHTGRPGVIAMENGFHGRTIGSLAVTAGESYRRPNAAVLPETHFVPFGDADAVAAALASRDDIGAVILEPIQSLGGMFEAPDSYFVDLRRLCDAHGVCLIFDEVQTGVGRTGTFSISEQLGVTPDLITLAKSLGSGVPVGAVLVSDEIASRVKSGDHGSTFGGGMLAMRAMNATLQMLEEGWMEKAQSLHLAFREGLEELGGTVRGRGCLIGVDFGQPAKPLVAALRQRGILVGGASHPNVIRLMPSLTTPAASVEEFLQVMGEVLATEAEAVAA
jgi:acetylornithine/N-succinyldiaminopimelate aminotransferase